jgi:hypothetical protein
MNSERHTIRKVEFPATHDFDDQLWPVNLALVLAAGCMGGLIWAICDFRTPVWYENGYFWMTVLIVTVFGFGGLAVYLGGRSGRRLQMAAFLSLALHGVGLASMKVTEPTPDPNPGFTGNRRELRAIDILPDYHMNRALPKAAREDLEKPVETKLSDKLAIESVQPRPREPRAGDAVPINPKNELVAIADPAPKLISPPLERKPIEPAAPRRGDLDAKLAKQQAPDETAPAAGPVKSIDLSVPTTKPGPIEARSMPVGRQTTDPTVPRRPDDNAVAMIAGLAQPGGPRSPPAPRTNDTASPLVALGPKLVKTIAEPGPAPRGEVPEPSAAAKAAIPDLSKLQPATGVGRQAPAGAVVGRTGMELASTEPIAAPRVALPSRDPARSNSVEPKLLDQTTPPRIASRTSSPAAMPAADIAKSAGQTSGRSADGGPGPGPLDSAEIKVARGSRAANAPPRTIGLKMSPLEGAGGFGVTIAMAGPQPGKAQDAAGPRPDPTLPLGGPVGPGKPGFAGIGSIPNAVPVAGLPTAAPPGGIAGTAGRSAPSDSPADGPSRVGIAKSSGGRVGPGRGEGFDAGMPNAAPKVSVSATIGTGGGVSARRGDGPGVAGGPSTGAGQPGGLPRSATSGAAPIDAAVVSPIGGEVVRAGGTSGGSGSVEVATLVGTKQSDISGPIGGGKGAGGTGGDDASGAPSSIAIGIGSGSGGGPGRLASSNEELSIGLGTRGQQLPRSIGGNGGAAGTASVAGGDIAAPATMHGGNGKGGPGGAGGDGIGPGGPIADSRATGASRTAPGAGIPGGAPIAGGSGEGGGPGGDDSGGGGGLVGPARIGRPGAWDEDMPGGIVGGVPGGLGSGIGRAGRPNASSLNGEVQGDLPQLAAGTPTGGSDRGSGTDGNGPGGDGSGPNGPSGNIDGPAGRAERQASGGLPGGGRGEGEGAGQPGTNVANTLGGAQIGPANGEGSPGISANGEGGPSAAGAGLGGDLPRSNSVGVPGSMDVSGAEPHFAGSPSSGGPGNNARGSSGGPGGYGPGGPGGVGPGGDGSGRRYGNAGLPFKTNSIGDPEGTAAVGAPQFGLPDRRALPDSDQLAISSGRFLQRSAGGGGPEVAADAPTRAPTPSFSGRAREGRGKGNGDGIGSDGRTEQAIELGLVYLAEMQLADGSWSLHRFPGATEADAGLYRSDTAATGLSLLAYLGAGYDHYDDKYRDTVRRGLEVLLRYQKPNGDLFVPMERQFATREFNVNSVSRLYSHSIATIAVCEALGMTGDKRLREPAQKAINFLVASQRPRTGGWRYEPGEGGDVSVTGWAVTALKSGELAGLQVPKVTFQRAARFLDSAQVSPDNGSRYLYNPDDRQAQLPSDNQRPTMTAVALLGRIYTGWSRDNPNMVRAAEFIKLNPPRMNDKYGRDTYYWYYATQVMFQLGGDYWKSWNERLHPLLINSQITGGPYAGSWDPRAPVPDRWGEVCGRIYVTAMNLLSLEVYYRHLPIYEVPDSK